MKREVKVVCCVQTLFIFREGRSRKNGEREKKRGERKKKEIELKKCIVKGSFWKLGERME